MKLCQTLHLCMPKNLTILEKNPNYDLEVLKPETRTWLKNEEITILIGDRVLIAKKGINSTVGIKQ